jgi:hypothetical protein
MSGELTKYMQQVMYNPTRRLELTIMTSKKRDKLVMSKQNTLSTTPTIARKLAS